MEVQIMLPSAEQIGEVQQYPTQYTLLGRLKDVEDAVKALPSDLESEFANIRSEIASSVEVANIVSQGILRPDNIVSYSAGDVVGFEFADSIAFANVLANSGDPFRVLSARLRISQHEPGATPEDLSVPAGMADFRIHLFKEEPTPMEDGESFKLAHGDIDKYLGYITLSSVQSLGEALFAQIENVNFMGRLSSEHVNLYGIIETLGAYEPVAETEYIVTLAVQRIKPAAVTG